MSFFHALWTCFVVITPCITAGITTGFSSIALPEMNLTLDEASWFGSLYQMASPFGCILSGYVIEKFGRKTCLMLSAVFAFIGYFLLAACENVPMIFTGRTLTGLSAGVCFFPAQVYMVEFLDLDVSLYYLRSSFTNWVNAAANWGYLLLFICGALMSYRVVAFISFVMSLCSFLFILFFIPESPVWLHQNKRFSDAARSEQRLRITASYENYPLVEKNENSSIFSKLRRRDVNIPLLITTIYWSLLGFAGYGVMSSYMINLINPYQSFSVQEAYNLCIVSGLLLFIGGTTVLFIIPIVGVRGIAIASTVGVSFSFFMYGVSIYDPKNSSNLQYLSVFGIWLGLFCCGFGYVSIPRAILAELFPSDAKGLALVPAIALYVMSGLVVKCHLYLALLYGSYLYYFYGAVAFVLLIFEIFFLPETVGRTTKQINSQFL